MSAVQEIAQDPRIQSGQYGERRLVAGAVFVCIARPHPDTGRPPRFPAAGWRPRSEKHYLVRQAPR